MDYLLGTQSVCLALSSINPPRVVITFYHYSNKHKHRCTRVLITVFTLDVQSDGKNSIISTASPSLPPRYCVSTLEIRVMFYSSRKPPRKRSSDRTVISSYFPYPIHYYWHLRHILYGPVCVCIIVERREGKGGSYLSSSTKSGHL